MSFECIQNTIMQLKFANPHFKIFEENPQKQMRSGQSLVDSARCHYLCCSMSGSSHRQGASHDGSDPTKTYNTVTSKHNLAFCSIVCLAF